VTAMQTASKFACDVCSSIKQKIPQWLAKDMDTDRCCQVPQRQDKLHQCPSPCEGPAGSKTQAAPQTLRSPLLANRDRTDTSCTSDSTETLTNWDTESTRTLSGSVDFVPAKVSTRKLSQCMNDLASVKGLGQTLASEVWLFFRGVPSHHGFRRFVYLYENFSLAIIALNILLAIVNSMGDLVFWEGPAGFRLVGYSMCYVFTVEYMCRLWSCVEVNEYRIQGPVWGRLAYMTRILPLVDLIVLLTMYANIVIFEIIHSGDPRDFVEWRPFRLIQMLRVFTVLKIERKTNSFNLLFKVLATKKSELYATLSLAATLMVTSSSLMYYFESPVQPEMFESIPASMWWAVTALTTVGYGDMVPITVPGKFVAIVVSIFGVGLFALPAGILGSGFVEVLQSSLIAECASKEQHILEEVNEENRKIDTLLGDMSELRGIVCKMQEDHLQVLAALRKLSAAGGSENTLGQTSATLHCER